MLFQRDRDIERTQETPKCTLGIPYSFIVQSPCTSKRKNSDGQQHEMACVIEKTSEIEYEDELNGLEPSQPWGGRSVSYWDLVKLEIRACHAGELLNVAVVGQQKFDRTRKTRLRQTTNYSSGSDDHVLPQLRKPGCIHCQDGNLARR